MQNRRKTMLARIFSCFKNSAVVPETPTLTFGAAITEKTPVLKRRKAMADVLVFQRAEAEDVMLRRNSFGHNLMDNDK